MVMEGRHCFTFWLFSLVSWQRGVVTRTLYKVVVIKHVGNWDKVCCSASAFSEWILSTSMVAEDFRHRRRELAAGELPSL